ncbi:hypothetical protein E2320_000682, partial [Naja naja]
AARIPRGRGASGDPSPFARSPGVGVGVSSGRWCSSARLSLPPLSSSPARQKKGRFCGAAVRAENRGWGEERGEVKVQKRLLDRAHRPLAAPARAGPGGASEVPRAEQEKKWGGKGDPPSPRRRRSGAWRPFWRTDEAQLKSRKVQYLAQKSVAAASQIQELLDFLNSFKVQVGILGEHRAGVTMLVEALLSKPRPVTNLFAYFREAQQPTLSAEVHVHPTFPHLVLHDLPGFEAAEKPAAYLKKLGDLEQFSCFVMVVGTRGFTDVHLQVLKAIKQRKKAFFVVRTKIDLDLHTAGRRLRYRHNPAEQMSQIRKELSETLTKDGLEAKKIFLVSGLQTERYDFAWFEDSLEGEMLNLKGTKREL